MIRPRAMWAIPAGLILGALFWAGVLYVAHLALAQVDLGGNVYRYMDTADAWRGAITGECDSACTMKLRHASCVAPDARLMFHPATSPIATEWMLAYYTPSLRAYVRVGGGVLTGAELARFGYRICQPQ